MKDQTGSKSGQKSGRFTASFVADRFIANGQSRFSAKEKNATDYTTNKNINITTGGDIVNSKIMVYLKLMQAVAVLFSFVLLYGTFILTLIYGWGLQPRSWLWILIVFPIAWVIGILILHMANYKEKEKEENTK